MTLVTYIPRVLLIDSDPELLTLLRTYLEEQELSVDCALDVAEAAVMIVARPYEVVLVGANVGAEALTSIQMHRSLVVGVGERRAGASHCFISRGEVVRHLRPFVECARELRVSSRFIASPGTERDVA